ncbi:MAG: caspase family protein [Bacteroidota bacterium]
MKLSYTFVLIIFLSGIQSVWAQKVDNRRVNVSYTRKPSHPLDQSIQFYKPDVLFTSGVTGQTLSKEALESKYLQLFGYTRSDDNYDVHIKAFVSPLMLDEVELNDREREKKIDGEKVKVKYYYYKVRYNCSINFEVSDTKGIIYRQEGSSNTKSKNTQEFESTYELRKYWERNQRSFLENIYREQVDNSFSNFSAKLSSRYCYTRQSRSTPINVPKSFKSYDYPEYNEAYNKAREGLSQLETNPSIAQKSIREAIAIWEKASTEINLDDKKARINKKVAVETYLNLAWAHVWLNEFDKATFYMDKKRAIRAGRLATIEGFVKDQQARTLANVGRVAPQGNQMASSNRNASNNPGSNPNQQDVQEGDFDESLFTEIMESGDQYYALIIGVSNYPDQGIANLDKAALDAKKLHKLLGDQYAFPKQNMTLLLNPGRNQIIDAFEGMQNRVSAKDNLLIFYAGHGYWDENANTGYWLPTNAQETSKANWVRNSTISDYVKSIKARHVLLVADACFSGSIFKARAAFSNAPKSITRVYKRPSRKAMTSGMLEEVPDASFFFDYFYKRLVENPEPFLAADVLFNEVKQNVISNIHIVPQYGVVFGAGDEGGEFIFVRKQ